MGLFEKEDESKPSEGLKYQFGESAALTLQRWSKILIGIQEKITHLENENKELWEVLKTK